MHRYNAILYVPYQLERLVSFGMLICADSFLVCMFWTPCLMSTLPIFRLPYQHCRNSTILYATITHTNGFMQTFVLGSVMSAAVIAKCPPSA